MLDKQEKIKIIAVVYKKEKKENGKNPIAEKTKATNHKKTKQ